MFWKITYDRAFGGHEESMLEYVEALDVFEALAAVLKSTAIDESQLDPESIEFQLEDNKIEISGEWMDNIVRGGSWNYFDLEIESTGIDKPGELDIEVAAYGKLNDVVQGRIKDTTRIYIITPIIYRKEFDKSVFALADQLRKKSADQ